MERIKKTNELIKKLQPYWKEYIVIEDEFLNKVSELEAKMEKEVGIEGIYFHRCDSGTGIGTLDTKLELIFAEELTDGEVIEIYNRDYYDEKGEKDESN